MLPHQTFLRNESILIYTLTTHQTSRRDDLLLVICDSVRFSFRRNDLCYATILNAPNTTAFIIGIYSITMSYLSKSPAMPAAENFAFFI